MRVFIPTLPLRALSPNGSHGNPYVVNSARQQLRADTVHAVQAAYAPADIPRYGRARVSVSVRVSGQRPRDDYYRPRDVPNVIAALKPVYDALVDLEVIADDDWRHMEMGLHRIERVADARDEGIAVAVEPLEAQDAEQPVLFEEPVPPVPTRYH